MSGWQVGDLALCIAGARLTRAGAIYRVTDVKASGAKCGCGNPLWMAGCALLFDGMTQADETGCQPWASSDRFRKIKPDTGPCEEEFTVLIKRGRKVSA